MFALIDNESLLLKVEQKLKKAKLKKVLPKIVCTFGCIVHIACSLDYFRYPTILDTIRKPETETSYTLTVCIDSYHFFAAKASMEKNSQGKRTKFHLLRSTLVNMSDEEMFKNTSDEQSIIAMCRMWGGVDKARKVNDLSVASDRLLLMETNGTKCHEYFRVKKSFIQSKICCSFTPTVKLDWNRDQLANMFDVGFNGYFYMVAISSVTRHSRKEERIGNKGATAVVARVVVQHPHSLTSYHLSSSSLSLTLFFLLSLSLSLSLTHSSWPELLQRRHHWTLLESWSTK